MPGLHAGGDIGPPLDNFAASRLAVQLALKARRAQAAARERQQALEQRALVRAKSKAPESSEGGEESTELADVSHAADAAINAAVAFDATVDAAERDATAQRVGFADDTEAKLKKKEGFNVPRRPSKQNTMRLGMDVVQIDSAIGVAANARQVRKFTKQTTLGRIMRTQWVEEASGVADGAEDEEAPVPAAPAPRQKTTRLARLRGKFTRRSTGGSSSASSGSELVAPAGIVMNALISGAHRRASSGSSTSGGSKDELEAEDDPPAASTSGVVSVDRNTRGFGTLNIYARQRPLKGHHPEYPFECLVFKGGGAKGSIYPGAIRALEDIGVMPHIKRFAGASAGAVVAALLASGLTAKQLFRELANTDLFGLIKDGESTAHSLLGLMTKFGMNPGNALYRYLGLIFYKYLGNADVTFQQLYDAFGVELAICVTNVTRAAVELLHVKTSPNYPIRKAVRMSMSLPFIIQPCKEVNVYGLVHEESTIHGVPASVSVRDTLQARLGLRRKAIKQMHKKREAKLGLDDPTGSLAEASEKRAPGSSPGPKTPNKGKDSKFNGASPGGPGAKQGPASLEFYVDGGVLNNYPIDAFDGWWLSMDPEDSFYRKLIGTGGHSNYITRFEGFNPKVLGFRLHAAAEPDAMHVRLGNDKTELKVRAMTQAKLPETARADEYAKAREEFTVQSKARVELEEDLRVSMDWVKDVHVVWCDPESGEAAAFIETIVECDGDIDKLFAQIAPPAELLRVLGMQSIDDLLTTIRPIYDTSIRDKSHLYEAEEDRAARLLSQGASAVNEKRNVLVTEYRMVLFEVEKLLENLAQDFMSRLVGAKPVETGELQQFLLRILDSIQMCNDERVQTKKNYRRTCVLDTEYVGVLDFKLEDDDFDFLWRKGYATTMAWLERLTSKKDKYSKEEAGEKKDKKEKKEKKEGSTTSSKAGDTPRGSLESFRGESSSSLVGEEDSVVKKSASVVSSSWRMATEWAVAQRREAERQAATRAAAGVSDEDVEELREELEQKDEALNEALEKCRELEARLRSQQALHARQEMQLQEAASRETQRAADLEYQMSAIQKLVATPQVAMAAAAAGEALLETPAEELPPALVNALERSPSMRMHKLTPSQTAQPTRRASLGLAQSLPVAPPVFPPKVPSFPKGGSSADSVESKTPSLDSSTLSGSDVRAPTPTEVYDAQYRALQKMESFEDDEEEDGQPRAKSSFPDPPPTPLKASTGFYVHPAPPPAAAPPAPATPALPERKSFPLQETPSFRVGGAFYADEYGEYNGSSQWVQRRSEVEEEETAGDAAASPGSKGSPGAPSPVRDEDAGIVGWIRREVSKLMSPPEPPEHTRDTSTA